MLQIVGTILLLSRFSLTRSSSDLRMREAQLREADAEMDDGLEGLAAAHFPGKE